MINYFYLMEFIMKLKKLDKHYENLLIDFFPLIEIKSLNNEIEVDDSEENFIKLHKICSMIPPEVILQHIETIIVYGKNRLIPVSLLKLIDEYQPIIAEEYFIDIKKEYEYFKFEIFHKEYEYKVFSFIDNHTNEESIKEKINEFIYKEIKLPQFIIEKIEKDLKEIFLNGFDINFDKYFFELTLASTDRSDYMGIFNHIETGKQIVIHPIQLSEQTGDVFFAGKYENFLRL